MTHGDKAKAKAAKSSKTSAPKASSKGRENGKGVKAKAVSQGSKAAKIIVKPPARAPEKVSSAKSGSPPKKPIPAPDPKAKAVGSSPTPGGNGFNNPSVAAAYKHAVKKYPNAFRKLTD